MTMEKTFSTELKQAHELLIDFTLLQNIDRSVFIMKLRICLFTSAETGLSRSHFT